MSNTKSPLEGITVEDFHRLVEDPMVTLGRALAPVVNSFIRVEMRKFDIAPKAKPGPNDYCPGCGDLSSWAPPGPNDYCPGCGDLSSWAPDLCPECLAVNTP